ncbi:MAG: electron transport complex subunit RsxE [Chromatiales bacterium]|nr:electron transport complex subunit RsxE [Chromatiales bacterium]
MNDVNPGKPGPGRILADGFWWNAPGLASLIGLCPLLAASRTLATGVALGLASLAVLCASNVLVAAVGHGVPPRFRSAAFLLLIAALVSAVDLLFQARWFDLYGQVGLFVPLIVTNCLILGRAEAFAVHQGPWPALLDGLGYGAGFTLLLGGLGALRELLAPVLLVAALPAGAFFLLAALVALRQAWHSRRRAA